MPVVMLCCGEHWRGGGGQSAEYLKHLRSSFTTALGLSGSALSSYPSLALRNLREPQSPREGRQGISWSTAGVDSPCSRPLLEWQHPGRRCGGADYADGLGQAGRIRHQRCTSPTRMIPSMRGRQSRRKCSDPAGADRLHRLREHRHRLPPLDDSDYASQGWQKVFACRRQLRRVFLLSVAIFGRHDERNRLGNVRIDLRPGRGAHRHAHQTPVSCSPLLPSPLPQGPTLPSLAVSALAPELQRGWWIFADVISTSLRFSDNLEL